MPISNHEPWVQVAELDGQNSIVFTEEFQQLVAGYEYYAKTLVSRLLGGWDDRFEHLLDYMSGNAVVTEDQPGEFESNGLTEAQDVVEYWPVRWADAGPSLGDPALGIKKLDAAWHRDVLRAKLVSLRLPRRLLEIWLKSITG